MADDEQINLKIEVDASQLIESMELAKETDKVIEFVSEKARKAMGKTITMIRATWAITQGVLQAAGISVSAQFRMIMSAVLGGVSMLIPLLTAQTMTPATMLQGFLGLMELTAAIAAMGVAESEFRQNEAAYFAAMRILNGVQALFGGMYFL